jgi:hypothetical protein
MGLAVMASPPLKTAVVSVLGEIGLLFGMGLVASLGAGQLLDSSCSSTAADHDGSSGTSGGNNGILDEPTTRKRTRR